jgi:L-cystine transport system permease protein
MNLFDLLREAAPVLLTGAGYTLLFAVAAMVGGLVLGFPTAVMRIAPWAPLRWPAALYVSVMRGTPLLVQLFVIYYGLPSVGIEFTPVTAGILALSLNAGAYLSESLRGAILSIGQGQWRASFSLGLTYGQALRFVVLPQALRVAVPSMSNTLISLIKDTSLVSVITMTELMLATKEVIATTFQPLPLYIAAAGIYWVLSLVFEQVQRYAERRLNRGHQPH